MIEFPNIDPVALNVGPFSIRWYGLAYAISFILAYQLLILITKKPIYKATGITRAYLDDLLFYGILCVVIGGRLGHVMLYTPSWLWREPLQIFKIWEGGMSFHGGFLGVVVASYYLYKKYKISVLITFDLIATVAPIGLFLGRIANFINAELYGRITNVPWGIVFPGTDNAARHPSQLYEACFEGIGALMLTMLLQNSRYNKYPGVICCAFTIYYGTVRILIENFKEPEYLLWQSLTIGQALSIPMVFGGVCTLVFLFMSKRR